MRWTINAGSAEEGATCLSSRPPKTQPASLTTSAYQTAEFNIAKALPVSSILPVLGFYTVPCLPDRRTLPTYPVSSGEHGRHRDSGMGSGTWWAALAKAKCQRFPPRSCISHRGQHSSGAYVGVGVSSSRGETSPPPL